MKQTVAAIFYRLCEKWRSPEWVYRVDTSTLARCDDCGKFLVFRHDECEPRK